MRTGGVDFVRVIWEISASIVISHTISARVKKISDVRSLPVIDKNLDMKSLGQNNVWRHTASSFKLQAANEAHDLLRYYYTFHIDMSG